MNPPLLVMNEPADVAGTGPWLDAFRAARWSGETLGIEVAGTGGTAAPEGGHLDMVDPAFRTVEKLGIRLHDDGFVGVGIGESGWAATVLGLARTLQALVLVDGVGAPFLDDDGWADQRRERLRAAADSAEQSADAPDPRAGQPVGSHHSLDLAVRAMSTLTIPVLVIETPQSAATAEQIDQIAAAGASSKVTRLASRDEAEIARTVVDWCAGLDLDSGF